MLHVTVKLQIQNRMKCRGGTTTQVKWRRTVGNSLMTYQVTFTNYFLSPNNAVILSLSLSLSLSSSLSLSLLSSLSLALSLSLPLSLSLSLSSLPLSLPLFISLSSPLSSPLRESLLSSSPQFRMHSLITIIMASPGALLTRCKIDSSKQLQKTMEQHWEIKSCESIGIQLTNMSTAIHSSYN